MEAGQEASSSLAHATPPAPRFALPQDLWMGLWQSNMIVTTIITSDEGQYPQQ